MEIVKELEALAAKTLLSENISYKERRAVFELIKEIATLMVEFDSFKPPAGVRGRVEETLRKVAALIEGFIYDKRRAKGEKPPLEEFKRAAEVLVAQLRKRIYSQDVNSLALVVLEESRRKLKEVQYGDKS